MSKQKVVVCVSPDNYYSEYSYPDNIFKYEINKKKWDSRLVPGTKGKVVRYFESNQKKGEINTFASKIDKEDNLPPIKGKVIFAKFKKGRLSNLYFEELMSIYFDIEFGGKGTVCTIL